MRAGNFLKIQPFIIILSLLLIFALTACSSPQNSSGQDSEAPGFPSADNPSDGADSSSPGSDGTSLPVVTLDDFKRAAAKYGEVQDMSDSFGYPSAAVTGELINLIYITPDSEKTAVSMITGEDEDESENIQVVASGDNYQYYEEFAESIPDEDIEAFYGYYLRVENMAILITGPADKREDVKKEAKSFYNELGYKNA